MGTLARLVTFTLHTHDNADSLSIAKIDGTEWQCVTQTSQWGDARTGIYISIDALVDPARPEFSFLASKASKKFADGRLAHRIKTMRLRGKLSQGLLIPLLSAYPHDADEQEFSWDTYLGIERYEPPTPAEMSGDQIRQPGSFVKYTSIENAKNHPDAIADGEIVRVSEKLHGTSFRAGFVDDGRDAPVYMVGTHATARATEGGNMYSVAARAYAPEERLLAALREAGLDPTGRQHVIVYGELYGAKVQDLNYGCGPNQRLVRLFDIRVDDVFQPWEKICDVAAMLKIDTVPLLYRGPYSREAILALRDGKTTIAGATHVREGVVVTVEPEARFIGSDGGNHRKIFKFISDDYLLRSGEKDGH